MVAGYYKVTLLKEGELPKDPSTPLPLLELAPVIGVEEPVVVGDVEILAHQSQNLSFGPEGVVANNNGSHTLLNVH